MNDVASSRANALKKGLPYYRGKQCPTCQLHKKRTKDKWCSRCYELGELPWQLKRDWCDDTRAHIAALERARYHAKKNGNARSSIMSPWERLCMDALAQRKERPMTAPNPHKATARKAGRKTYTTGIACSECDTDKRYVVSGNCVECGKAHAKAYARSEIGQEKNRERQARYRARQAAKKNALIDDI